jgi:Na+-driven multidrug efflux pump
MNIIGNYLLIFIFKFAIKGVAFSTLTSRITTFFAYQIIMLALKFELFVNPLTLFKIGKNILRQYFKRSFFLIFSSLTFILIELRLPLFSRGYPIGSLGPGAGAMSVFALTFAIMNIFLTSFSAISATAANFVGKELGKGNLKQALINSDQLKGFNTSISIFLSLIFFALTFAIPSMGFLATNEPSKDIILQNVKYTC